MEALADGEALLVLATDPEAPIDLEAWARASGHAYTERERRGYTEYELVKHGRARRPA